MMNLLPSDKVTRIWVLALAAILVVTIIVLAKRTSKEKSENSAPEIAASQSGAVKEVTAKEPESKEEITEIDKE